MIGLGEVVFLPLLDLVVARVGLVGDLDPQALAIGQLPSDFSTDDT
jgi:hypothetical protein